MEKSQMEKLQNHNYKNAKNVLQLEKSFKVTELKHFLKENNLKRSAPRKKILAQRLFDYIKDLKTISSPIKIKLINLLKKSVLDDYSTKDYVFTLSYYKLKSTGSSKILKKRLCRFAKMKIKYSVHKKSLIKIQNTFRKFLTKKINKLRGMAYHNRSICHNKEDFITFEDLEKTPNIYFYSFQDIDDFVYGFNIKTFYKFVITTKYKKPYNPYNNIELSNKIIDDVKNIVRLLNILNHDMSFPMMVIHDKKAEIKEKAFSVFQKFNMLNNYTDANWFLELGISKLKKLYEISEDIWNYRAVHLTKEIRKKHIPKNNAFLITPHKIYQMKNKNEIQNIVLDEFDRFVTEGVTREERKTGAMWMLTALVEVSPNACESMPWLLQNPQFAV